MLRIKYSFSSSKLKEEKKMNVEVVFMVTDDGPIFYGVFDSYLEVQKYFKENNGVEKEGVKGLGCFEMNDACYTVQTNELNKPLF
ncbi:MAG: hypothetical protein LLG05_17840 [Porphyromonadaceae bacterium]|nr:hypothetical protein [Porphyromonadaceae bacterium]